MWLLTSSKGTRVTPPGARMRAFAVMAGMAKSASARVASRAMRVTLVSLRLRASVRPAASVRKLIVWKGRRRPSTSRQSS